MKVLCKTLASLQHSANLVAQCHDGAKNMFGQYGGVQKLLSNTTNKRVMYVWCNTHILNLVLCDLCNSSVQIVTLFGVLETCYNVFTNSAPAHLVFE